MKRSQRHTAGRALAFAGAVVASSAFAQPVAETETTRFEFRAPAGCSSAEDFAARVARRSRRIRLVTDPSVRRSLLVEIQQTVSTGALRGIVRVAEADGTMRTRQLKATSCEEAVEGLSLIATVTLDPDALTAEPARDEPPPPPEPKKPPSPGPKKPPPSIPRAVPSEPYRFSFGLAGALLVRMAPELVPGATVSAALEIDPGRVVSPFGRLSLTHAQRRGIDERGGKAAFAFTLPTLDVCPVRLGPRALALRPCAFGTLGLLRAWGDATLQNETHSRLYGAAGAAAWLAWRVTEALEIIADGRVGLPFWRDRFAFDGSVFFETPTPGFSVGLGVAGGFP